MPVTYDQILAKMAAYLRMEEVNGTDTRVDATGRGNNGAPINGPTSEPGKLLQACSFDDDAHQYLVLPDGDDTRINEGESVSFVCWARLHANQNPAPVIWKGPPEDSDAGYALTWNGGVGTWTWYVCGSDMAHYTATINASHVDDFTAGPRFFVCTFTPGALRFRVDATIATGVASLNARITPDDLWIGHNAPRAGDPSSDAYINGWIDEFMILKPALTPEEEDFLWNGGAGLSIPISVVRRLQFGDYEFPLGWRVVEDPNRRVVPLAKLPRADGARALPGYLDQKEIVVEGGFYQGPFDDTDIRPRIDALRAALAEGPTNLYIYTDRFYRAMQAADNPDTYIPTGFNRLQDSRIVFRGPDPYQYSTSISSDTWISPGDGDTRGLAGGGNTYAYPTYTVTVGGVGDVALDISLSNLETGETFRLAGACAAGDVIVVDAAEDVATLFGNRRMDLYEGQRIRLRSGGNTLALTVASGSVASIVTTWRRRWL